MTILIPIDFSETSLKAAHFAMKHYADAKFKLLHIVNARQAGATMVVDINSDLQKFYQKRMIKVQAELEQKFPNVKIEGKVEIGLFSETIVEEIENCSADLLVLGT
ncbi:MAG: universal stress protein, partial [Putridiphycobacter sp.]|nr:universal stress protein [Putridiphycobacter sp.]